MKWDVHLFHLVPARTHSHHARSGKLLLSKDVNSFGVLIGSLDDERLWQCLY